MKSEKKEEKKIALNVYNKESGLNSGTTTKTIRQNSNMTVIRGPT